MEIFDYRESSDVAENISAEIDDLSIKELLTVHEAIKEIKTDTEAAKAKQGAEWLEKSIIPILKSYAQATGSILEVEQMDKKTIVATLKNRSGFDIFEQFRLMYLALLATVHISIEESDGELVLVLAYDTEKFSYD